MVRRAESYDMPISAYCSLTCQRRLRFIITLQALSGLR